MGNVVAVTDGNGIVVERYDYSDFGDPKILDLNYTPVSGNQSTIGNPYLFTGRRYDPETGLYWYRTRYYDPVAGRFTSRDRIGIWGDPFNLGNGLVYVGNSPWTWVDAFGLSTVGPDGVVGTYDRIARVDFTDAPPVIKVAAVAPAVPLAAYGGTVLAEAAVQQVVAAYIWAVGHPTCPPGHVPPR